MGAASTFRMARRGRAGAQAEGAEAAGCGPKHARKDAQEEHGPQRRDASDRDRSETYAVTAYGELLVCEPADKLPMAQRSDPIGLNSRRAWIAVGLQARLSVSG